MGISRWSRRFHDPWGNKSGNRHGHICRFQYLVGKGELKDTVIGEDSPNANSHAYWFDTAGALEYNKAKYVRTGRESIESLRR